ncbi:SIS domain-containing protein [Choiromyces venosus 120613-1]|uniref:SIS domain-containing protein n=1 Tax=Choiromyces venosus 120613-1 TaxID=1336337 RepID=A0A3N4J6E6_9PEZI|nr:SIS domain-containing protein [Choiromyces venosus 120613-1]
MDNNTDFFCRFRNRGNNSPLAQHLSSLSNTEAISSLPITPPTTDVDPEDDEVLSTAVHVLSTEAMALSCLSRLYATDPVARNGFVRAVEAISTATVKGGKVVIIGVGKSGKIGEKMVATMNSLGLLSVFMHPIEALHGDLGMVKPKDVLLLITFSGNTPELISLLPHLPGHLPLIALTSHTSYHTSPLTRERKKAILLPAPIHEAEETSFGISAPTTSTTVALALGDALAVASARQVHTCEGEKPKDVFKRNHPGGAIGLGTGKGVVRMLDLAVRLEDIPVVDGILEDGLLGSPPISSTSSESDLEITEWTGTDTPLSTSHAVRVIDCLLAGVGSKTGWVRVSEDEVVPPGRLKSVRGNVQGDVYEFEPSLVVGRSEMVRVSGQAKAEDVKKWVMTLREEEHGAFPAGTVLGVCMGDAGKGEEVIAVIEVDELMKV